MEPLEEVRQAKDNILAGLREDIARFQRLERFSALGYYVLMILSVVLGAATGVFAAFAESPTLKISLGIATSVVSTLNVLIPAKQHLQRRSRTWTRLRQIARELETEFAGVTDLEKLRSVLRAATEMQDRVETAEQNEWKALLESAKPGSEG